MERLCKELGLPVEKPFIEAHGYTANTAVMAILGRLRIQRAYETNVKSNMKMYLVRTPAFFTDSNFYKKPFKSDGDRD